MRYTDVLIRAAKPKGKAYKLPKEAGLYLLVGPNGSKGWRLAYRHGGKEKLISLGRYPEVSLQDARKRRDEARALLATGADPSAERQAQKARSQIQATNTFQVLVAEWLSLKAESLAPVTHNKARWMLETFALPHLGPLPVDSITPPDVLKALRVIETSGRLETMHRTKARISEVFRYAIATGRATSDPCRDLRGALKAKRPTRHFAALTDVKQIGELLRAIDGYCGSHEVRAALKLAPLLFARPGELRSAQWPQFDLEGDTPTWRYHVSKTKTDHIVPLSVQVVAILRELQPLTDNSLSLRPDAPRYVFPGARTRLKPMSENTVNAALRNLGYTGEQVTGHGFRAMARTLLAEMGWLPDAIERQLAHKPAGPLGAAYDRAQYLAERRKMMQAWADYLDSLRAGNSKVTPLRAA